MQRIISVNLNIFLPTTFNQMQKAILYSEKGMDYITNKKRKNDYWSEAYTLTLYSTENNRYIPLKIEKKSFNLNDLYFYSILNVSLTNK